MKRKISFFLVNAIILGFLVAGVILAFGVFYKLATNLDFRSIAFWGVIILGVLLESEFWLWLMAQWRFLIPGFVGSFLLSALLGLGSYPLVLYAMRKYRGPSAGRSAG